MAGLTLTVWEPDSPTLAIPDGASGLATDIPTILGITLGGDQWDITVMGGIPITAGERGAVQPLPTCTEFGAARLTLVPAQLGRIRIPATTERRRVAPTTITRPVGPRSPGAAAIRISTRATRPAIAAVRLTIRIPASSQAAEPVTRETFTAVRARPGAADLPTIPIREQGSLRARTTSTPAKMARSIATTGRTATGLPTAAAAGRTQTEPIPACNGSNRLARKARSEPRTSTQCAATEAAAWEAPAWAAAEGDNVGRFTIDGRRRTTRFLNFTMPKTQRSQYLRRYITNLVLRQSVKTVGSRRLRIEH